MELNEYQTSIEDLHLENYNKEIVDQFFEFINSVPFIQKLIAKDRPKAKDLPKDAKGRIIVDITEPHILEDMNYFRPTAIHFETHNCYTFLRPNTNPHSEFYRWFSEEIRRCREGYVRESDGEWVTGDFYFFLNYCPMTQTVLIPGTNMANRIYALPELWEGHYYKYHYILQAREAAHHGAELASRGKGKSYSLAAMIAKRFILGESQEVNKEVKCIVTAYQKEYLMKDGILTKFQSYLDFIALNTQFPKRRLTTSPQTMTWTMGYIDMNTMSRKGSLNEVLGVSSKDDESKLRGKRGVLIAIEEFGSFPNLLGLYGGLRPNVEEGNMVFGLIYMQGTAGDNASDFAAAQEIMYNSRGYNMHAVANVYDKTGQGKPHFVYFFPGYLNRKGCYEHNGNSDVTKALLEILVNRFEVKYNTSDVNAITKAISEVPITPQEAIIKSRNSIFPITELTERVNQLDNDPKSFDDVFIGELVLNNKQEVIFKATNAIPIREFPTKDNKVMGALEIFQMPEKNSEGRIPNDRYIISSDPYDDDSSSTMSLGSMFVFDLWTDRIVAEYTGRPEFANDFYEIIRKACLFYNAKCMYENNKKGQFSYFSRMNGTYLLADTPEYLKDKQLIKEIGYGNKSKGICATQPIKLYGYSLIRDWLLKPVNVVSKDSDNDEETITIANLYRIRNRALLKELILWNPDINVDRIMSLVQLMLYREEKMVLYNGNLDRSKAKKAHSLAADPFFSKNYDDRLNSNNTKDNWMKD